MSLSKQTISGTRHDGTTVKVDVTVSGDPSAIDDERAKVVNVARTHLSRKKNPNQYTTMESVIETLED